MIIDKYPHISISNLHKLIKKKYNDFDITSQHLGSVVGDNNITRKRTRRRHYPEFRYGKPTNLKRDLSNFYKVVEKYSLDKIICLDEISIHAMMKPSYSRCSLGKRCVMKTTNNKVFQKYTLLAGISTKGVIGWKIYENGGVTAERMCAFLDDYISGKYVNHLVIMDNAGSHRSKLVKEKVKKTKNHLQYSVPYKPKTNAIEKRNQKIIKISHRCVSIIYILVYIYIYI